MPNINVDYFVVGGGGGGVGGANATSPGGAGGVRSGTISIETGTIYTITVGLGGVGTTAANASTGSASTFYSISASGGGGGTVSANASSGGSGAGAPGSTVSYTGGSGNVGGYTPVEGYAGGNNNITSPYPSGGGGGAGGVGKAGTGSQSGNGGTGTFTTLISTTTGISLGIGQYITATNALYFAGGGGGGATTTGALAGTGGSGGGGNGAATTLSGTTGTNYTGGGGGAGSNTAGTYGGNGGSGVVILRYVTSSSVVGTNAAYSVSSGTYTTYIFTTSGTINFIGPLGYLGYNVDMLIVAGGGGGGSDMGGGGGAGGVLNYSNRYIDPGSYSVTVGAGGSGASAGVSQARGINGSDSMIISTSTTATNSVMLQASQSLGAGIPYTAISFTGTNAYLSIPYSLNGPTDLSTGAPNWTVECWFRCRDVASGVIFWGGGTSGTVNPSPGLSITNGILQWIVGNGSTSGTAQSMTRVITVNSWNHFALVRNGLVLTAYINGVADATTVTMGFTMAQNTNPFGIGAAIELSPRVWFKGDITNFRIVKGTAVYTSNFDPTTSTITAIAGTTLLLLSTSTSITDYSGSNTAITVNGTQTLSTATNGPTNNFLFAGDFTVEAWVYRIANGDLSMFGQGANPSYFSVTVNPGSGMSVYLNSTSPSMTVTDRVPQRQTWNHIALVRRSNVVSLYLNGIPSTTTVSNSNTLGYNTTQTFYIGAVNTQSVGTVFAGTSTFISNFRVVNGTAVYTATFFPSTIPLTTVTNTVLLALTTSTISRDISTSSLVLASNGAVGGHPGVSLYTPFNSFYTAVGGGGGASEYSVNTSPASFGGSGGGVAGGSSVTFGLGISGQGFQGGATPGNFYPGGGGGAGTTGTTGVSTGAKGGDGISSAILGTTYYWGGGGGGAGYTNIAGNGGAGGGGGGAPLNGGSASGTGGGYGNTQGINAGSNSLSGALTPAQPNVIGGSGGTNTGGGGGGGSHYDKTNAGGSGGSGAVIIRYAGGQRASGGTIYTYTTGSTYYTAHAFFSSGIFTLYPTSINPQQTGGIGGPYGGGGGGSFTFFNQTGGLGAPGSSLSSGYPSLAGGGGGGGASTSNASGGGGGVDIYGVTGVNGIGGAPDASGTGGSTYWFNVGGQPGSNGNGGLYGGGGAGAAVGSVDTAKGNGAGGALFIVYNTTASAYFYPNIMPLVSNNVNTSTSLLLTLSTTTGKTLLTQFDNFATSYQDLQYDSIATKNPTNYGNTDFIAIKQPQSQTVLAGNSQITTYVIDHEMMLKNSDTQLPASWDKPGNYQYIQEITPANDPRLITVRVQNFVIGVTGSDSSITTAVTAGGQVWY